MFGEFASRWMGMVRDFYMIKDLLVDSSLSMKISFGLYLFGIFLHRRGYNVTKGNKFYIFPC